MSQPKLEGRVTIVTGSSSGIGAAIALRVAADGAHVVVNYNSSADEAAKVVAQIEKDGGKAVAVQADMSDPGDIVRLFDEAERAFGPVNLLVNNAAYLKDDMPLFDVNLAAYEKTFNLNIRGPILSMVEFAKRLNGESGAVVNISSGQARAPRPGSGLYASTKGAIESATRAFAADIGPAGIRINAVAPGATATDNLLNRVPQAELDAAIARTPLRRLGQPEDIADVVAFLLCDDARWITGQVVNANGGMG